MKGLRVYKWPYLSLWFSDDETDTITLKANTRSGFSSIGNKQSIGSTSESTLKLQPNATYMEKENSIPRNNIPLDESGK